MPYLTRTAGLFIGALLLIVSACQKQQDPRALVEAAIEAHGGRERLATLDNVKVIGHGRFKEQLETTGTISFVAPASWAVEARLQGNSAMLFGMDGTRCWRRDGQFVSDCSADAAEYRRFGEIFRLRLLRGLEDQALVSAGERNVRGTTAPAVRVGDFVLAFDPESHRLIGISAGNREEVYSDFRTVNGALVAAHRTLFIDGAVDVEETWDEILPGRADLDVLHPPPPQKDGDTLEGVSTERWMLTTVIRDLAGDINNVVGSLDDYANAQGQKVSTSEGFVLTQTTREPGQEQEWEISVGLEPTSAELPSHSKPPFRFERWPETRFFGIFHMGGLQDTEGKQALLRKVMDRSGAEPAPGSRWQFVCPRATLQVPPAERLCLLQLAVADRVPPPAR